MAEARGPTALARYDTAPRRLGVNHLIGRAQWMGDLLVSDSLLTTFALHSLARWDQSYCLTTQRGSSLSFAEQPLTSVMNERTALWLKADLPLLF